MTYMCKVDRWDIPDPYQTPEVLFTHKRFYETTSTNVGQTNLDYFQILRGVRS